MLIVEEAEKQVWVIDLTQKGRVLSVDMNELFYCGATDTLAYEENDEIRPIWILVEGDHEETCSDL